LQRQQHTFQARPFLADLFRAPRIRPDIRIFEILQNLIQPVEFVVEVKGTSSALQRAAAGL
jgi:hypothetical protein